MRQIRDFVLLVILGGLGLTAISVVLFVLMGGSK